MNDSDSSAPLPCPVDGCLNTLARARDLICPGDFTVLASTCRGKRRLGDGHPGRRRATGVPAARHGAPYCCLLCGQWHNGHPVRSQADHKTSLRDIIRALRRDRRCGTIGLRNLTEAWSPPRVNRDSWWMNLDQREAYAIP